MNDDAPSPLKGADGGTCNDCCCSCCCAVVDNHPGAGVGVDLLEANCLKEDTPPTLVLAGGCYYCCSADVGRCPAASRCDANDSKDDNDNDDNDDDDDDDV